MRAFMLVLFFPLWSCYSAVMVFSCNCGRSVQILLGNIFLNKFDPVFLNLYFATQA